MGSAQARRRLKRKASRLTESVAVARPKRLREGGPGSGPRPGQASARAHEATQAATNATYKVGSTNKSADKAADHSQAAVDASASGDHKASAYHHKQAAEQHRQAASASKTEGERQAHINAAGEHEKAASHEVAAQFSKQRESHQPQPSRAPTLREYFNSGGTPLKVDRENCIIHGVKVLGTVSKNNRRYENTAIASALPLYEGAKVNTNHPSGNEPHAPRDYEDRLGRLQGARIDSDGGIKADLKYNPKHRLAEQLCWDAENAPENVGLSHNIDYAGHMDGKTLVIDRIEHVQGVDLVADPATTKGLFEYDSPVSGSAGRMPDSNFPVNSDQSTQTNPKEKPMADCPIKEDDETEDPAASDPKTAAFAAISAKLHALVDDEDGDPAETAAQLKKLLMVRAKAMDGLDAALGNGEEAEGGDDEQDDEEDGMESIRRRKPKGAKTVTESEELKKLREQVERQKRQNSARELMESAGLPHKMRTKLLLKQLTEATDEDRKAIVEDRQLMAEELRMQRPTSRDESFLTENVANSGMAPSSSKQLVESLHVVRE